MSYATANRRSANGERNKLYAEDQSIHQWYRFVLSFPPHLVANYLERFGIDHRHQVLDPFCGTGTTLVECKKRNISSVGIEANPVAHFASLAKVTWNVDADELLEHARRVAAYALSVLEVDGIYDENIFPGELSYSSKLRTLPNDKAKLLLRDSISPLPLHKTLVLLECLEQHRDARFHRHELLALAKALTTSIGNLHFGPEVGVGPAKVDASVVSSWLAGVRRIADDLRIVRDNPKATAVIHCADARDTLGVLKPASIDAVITSPPYPNEKDYTRTTRLEAVILGYIQNKADLRALKGNLVRSNTRNVYKEDNDDEWIAGHPEIQRIADAIEARRIELGKTSGFERLYPRVTKLYFGGMARHLADLRPALRPGAQLAYVVGDQASYLRVMIRTGQILGEIAKGLGYEVKGIDLFRTRLATATKEQLREEVVILRWPGTTDTLNSLPRSGTMSKVTS